VKILTWLDKHIELIFLTCFLIIITCLTTINIVLRYVFDSGIIWSTEICKYCLIYSGFFSIGWWLRWDKSILVNVVTQKLPQNFQYIFEIVAKIITIYFLAICTRGAINVLKSVIASGEVSGTLQISLGYLYMAPLIGFSWALFRSVQNFILTIKKRVAICQ
jgi:TRAP-type C4-dicarboxylate transport system permease small subunit